MTSFASSVANVRKAKSLSTSSFVNVKNSCWNLAYVIVAISYNLFEDVMCGLILKRFLFEVKVEVTSSKPFSTFPMTYSPFSISITNFLPPSREPCRQFLMIVLTPTSIGFKYFVARVMFIFGAFPCMFLVLHRDVYS